MRTTDPESKPDSGLSAPTRDGNVVKTVTLDAALVQGIVDYLKQQPYEGVYVLIASIMQAVQAQHERGKP